MNEEGFVKRREPDWQRLYALIQRPLPSLSASELEEVFVLHRRVSGDLATVRTLTNNGGLVEFLNQLVGQGHSVLYRRRRIGFWSAIGGAIATIAQTFRRNLPFIGFAAGLFLLSAFAAAFLVNHVPGAHDVLVPPGWDEVFDHWKKGSHEAGKSSSNFAATGFYASNNPMAAIGSASVSAVSFGVLTFFVVFQNGALLGVLGADMAPLGLLPFLLNSILPHGVTEISGLFVSAGAGFRLGWSMIAPGRISRAESMRRAGKDATVLLGTSVLMMLIAAPIEGFFSFNGLVPSWAKYLFAAASAVAWACFWTLVGRTDDSAMVK
ncbi:MAG: stage II sporulation protein M [Fimbriimonas sp.]